jgi:DNA-binding response OmpR family regulator
VPSHQIPRVFVVDDEQVIASTLAVILRMNGFSSRYFTRPSEALTAAQSDPPDLLISDVAMPGLSGIDLAIQMRAQHPKCKILLFSGQTATSDLLADARKQGHVFHLLLKPVPPSELLAEIAVLDNEAPSRSLPHEAEPICASQGHISALRMLDAEVERGTCRAPESS